MAALFKQLNSSKIEILTFTNEDLASNSLPIKTAENEEIPVNSIGVNLDNFDIYYWTGNEWKKSE